MPARLVHIRHMQLVDLSAGNARRNPSSGNENILDSNLKPKEKIMGTGECNYVGKYKASIVVFLVCNSFLPYMI